MMKKEFLLIAGMFLLLSLSLVSAQKVGYILVNDRNADAIILDVFADLGLTWDLIEDANVKSVNLNNYDLLFIDDVRLKNTKTLPIYNYPAVIMNKYYGYQWGFTDFDGVSQLSATSPLQVRLIDNGVRDAYTSAKNGGMYLDYYYLDDLNRADVVSIARTYTGQSNGLYDFGDVVATVPSGTFLKNGKIAGDKMCFYGIHETKYWTSTSRQLFEDCVGSVIAECVADSDCGQDSYGDYYCKNNDVYRMHYFYQCVNSECQDNAVEELVEDCADVCVNGECKDVECYDDSDCDDGDDYTIDTCINPGTVNSNCEHNPVQCLINADCGTNYYGNNYCGTNGNVYRDSHIFSCNSYICNEIITPELVETCADICINGQCQDIECYDDSDCDDSNSYTADKCHNAGTINSYCTNEQITCFTENDCGIDGFIGGLYCDGPLNKDVWRNYQDWTCQNPGTVFSTCNLAISSQLYETCSDTCLSGSCIDILCYNDADCDDNNAGTSDYCVNPGTLQSYCTHEGILCFQKSDCGTDRFTGGLFCDGASGDDVYRDYLTFSCNNPGTNNAFCGSSTTASFLYSCEYACANGYCVRCNENSDCNDNNDNTEDICRFPATIDSYCTHEHITCYADSECGADSYIGSPYCLSDDVYQDYREFDCVNSGTVGSYCDDDINPVKIEDCNYGCALGSCLAGVHDVGFDLGNGVNGILFEYTNGTDITEIIPQLDCRDIIKAKVVVENFGDFTENGTVEGNLNGVDISFSNIINLIPGDDTSKTSLSPYINLAGLSGLYNIMINAIIPVDDIPGNNAVTRQIQIICPDCYIDSDCGSQYYGNNYCSGKDVYHDSHIPICVSGTCSENIIPEKIETCADVCINGECKDIECYDDGDCGNDGFTGNLFCQGKDVFQNYQDNFCANKGTPTSYCDYTISALLKQTCSAQCYQGQCVTCTPGTTQQCGTSNTGECKYGTQTCSSGGIWGSCAGSVNPASEICDEKDNDCDGQADETFTNKGSSCNAGIGECRRTGNYICSADKLNTVCSAVAGTPATEICDGKDNDCDGQVDEGNVCYVPHCRDGIDNDGDGFIDYPDDAGCSSSDDDSESPYNIPQCADGWDNDGDGKSDYPADPQCTSLYDLWEAK